MMYGEVMFWIYFILDRFLPPFLVYEELSRRKTNKRSTA